MYHCGLQKQGGPLTQTHPFAFRGKKYAETIEFTTEGKWYKLVLDNALATGTDQKERGGKV